jgi:hypothetical protein
MTTSYILKRQAELRKNKALMRAAERAESEVVAENNRLAKLADAARLQENLARIKQGVSSAGFCGN